MDLFRFVTHVLRVALTLAQFVLAFFPDKEKSTAFILEEVCVRVLERGEEMFLCELVFRGRGVCRCKGMVYCTRVCSCPCVHMCVVCGVCVL